MPQHRCSPAAVQILLGGDAASKVTIETPSRRGEAAIAAGARCRRLAPLLVDATCARARRAPPIAQRDLAGANASVVRRLRSRPTRRRRNPGRASNRADARFVQQPDDLDAQWLALHALFSSFVSGTGPGAMRPAGGFADLAARYVAAGGATRRSRGVGGGNEVKARHLGLAVTEAIC